MLGTVLTVGGLLWGAGELRADYHKLEWQMRGVSTILRSEMPADEKTCHIEVIIQPTSSWNDVKYLRELIRLYILEQAVGSLREPLALTLLGVVLSTGASVWSLWA
ncbi:hypothetical protein ACIQVK_10630 [Streptomyces sp. NPDC090493]|uniref:hypothetical protein n=1 Tax=Streptomyces sp. NPDC090493 TaxID=3365964 RepID=UPI003828193F